MKTMSSGSNPRLNIRRSSTRQIYWNPQTGLDGFGGASSLQMTFSPSAIDYRFAGTSIYVDSLPNVTELSALFDQYRISNVTLRIDYTTDIFNNSGTAYKAPLVLAVVDYDDIGTAGVADLLQYPKVVTHSFDQNGYTPFMVSLKPRPLLEVGGSGISSGYAPMTQSPHIRTTNLNIPHYGFKLAILSNGASANQVVGYFQITVLMDMEFINVK